MPQLNKYKMVTQYGAFIMSFPQQKTLYCIFGRLFCLLLIVAPSSAWSGKMYKWIDHDGQVHYSQIPPQKNQVKDESGAPEKLSARANTIPATRKGDFAYCGKIKLPGPLYEPKKILLGLGSRLESWNESLQKNEQSLTRQLRELGSKNLQKSNKYNRSRNVSYNNRANDSRKNTARKIKEYRCALAWADRQKEKYSDIKQEVSHDLKGAKSNYQEALNTAHKKCGFEPKDYASPDYNTKKSTWKKCMRPHNRKISSSERTLKRLRSQATKLE